MKFKYMHETIYGSADDVLKRVNELGDDGWEVVHVSTMNTESHVLSPAHMVWFKRERKKSDD